MGERLGTRSPSVDRGGEGGQHVLIEEVGERPVAHVVEQAGDPQRFDDQPLGRDEIAAGTQRRSQRGIQRPRPQPCLVHHAQTVREPGVLGGREDPACRLQLADPAEPLQPRGVQQVLLGDILVEQPRGARLDRRQPLGELEVAVDGIGDEIDGGERVPPRGTSGQPAQGTAIRISCDHAETVPPRSRGRGWRCVPATTPMLRPRTGTGLSAAGP